MKEITDISGKITLNNAVEMPYFGLGVFMAKDGEEVYNSVVKALEKGYRLIDTASVYGNETGVGKAINDSNVKREEIFITTKLWNNDQGYESTFKAFEKSLNRLNTDYVDLYLIHWPVAGKYIESWRAIEKLYSQGHIKSIGVSNFTIHHLKDLMENCETKPMVNQVEFHPYLQQPDLFQFCSSNNIYIEAWMPIMRGKVKGVPEIQFIATKYNKTEVQICLRWELQRGVITIPKSVNPDRIKSNADIFDFELTDEDISIINHLDQNKRLGPDPLNFSF